ncbi:MAG: hypothetical protein IKC63_03710 [Clostridia bacterium]|nr:hypothetical protein [Clostridia bacterium]
MKKLLSLVLSLAMLIGVLGTVPFFAAEAPSDEPTEPTGTPISSVEEFENMASEGDYYLTGNLDFTGRTYDDGRIGPDNFSGTFDGCGYSFLNINISAASDTGVFGINFKGTLKNLTIGSKDAYASVTCTVSGKAVGTVASTCQDGATFENITVYAYLNGGDNKTGNFGGYCSNGANISFKNCHVYGTVSGTPASGFIANQRNDAPIIIFENCSNNADISNASGNSCPVAGFYANKWEYDSTNVHTMTFINCVNNGNFSTATNEDRNSAAGFVCGNSPIIFDLTFENCTNNGNVTATNGSAAGFATVRNDGNRDEQSSFKFNGCVNNGTIKADVGVGSAAGILALPSNDVTGTVVIKNSINTGDVIGGKGSAGGIFNVRTHANERGKTLNVTITACANLGNVSAKDWRAGGIVGMLGMSEGTTAHISYCYNAGNISNPGQTAAGIVGELAQFAPSGTKTVEYCYNRGALEGNSTPQIARCGQSGLSDIMFVKNCYFLSAEASGTWGEITTENVTAANGEADLLAILKALPATEDGVTFVEDRALINNGAPILSFQQLASLTADNFAEGTIVSGDTDNAYTISSPSVSAFISARSAGDNANDIRFVLAADYNTLVSYETLTITVEFATKAGVVKSMTIPLEKITFFADATAAGHTYTAAENCVLFGCIITEVPNSAWDYAVLSISTTPDGTPAMSGTAIRSTILG